MSKQREYRTFGEFWPFYVGAHKRRVCRVLHYIGLGGAAICVVLAIVTGNPWWLLGAPVVGYGSSWFGHFRFERNQPATFEYPFYSILADFKMMALGMRGKMGEEVRRYHG